jgi:hypothetical protein
VSEIVDEQGGIQKLFTVSKATPRTTELDIVYDDMPIKVKLKDTLKYQGVRYNYKASYQGAITPKASDSIFGSYTATLKSEEGGITTVYVLCLTVDAAKAHFRLFTTEGTTTKITNNTFDYKKVNNKISLYEAGSDTAAPGLATLADQYSIITQDNKIIGAIFDNKEFSFTSDTSLDEAAEPNPQYDPVLEATSDKKLQANLQLGNAYNFWIATKIDTVVINGSEENFDTLDEDLKAIINKMVRLADSQTVTCFNYEKLAKPTKPIFNPANNLVYCFHSDFTTSQAEYKTPFDRKLIYKINRPDSSDPSKFYLVASGEVVEKFDEFTKQSLPALFYLEPGDVLTIRSAASFYEDSDEEIYIHTEYGDTEELIANYILDEAASNITEVKQCTNNIWGAETTLEIAWPPITIEINRDANGEWTAKVKDSDEGTNEETGEDIE